MPSTVLLNTVANPNATIPTSLNLSLTSKGVVLNTIGNNVKALLFADTTKTLTGILVSLTVNGCNFRVDLAYNGVQFAVLSSDGSSSLFTCATGTVIQTSTFNGFNTVGSEKLRKWNQESGGF
jgi:hypothetical protein